MPDALASWKDGAAKSAILDFVRRVANQGSPDFVAPVERIAVFDNDATLQVYRGQHDEWKVVFD